MPDGWDVVVVGGGNTEVLVRGAPPRTPADDVLQMVDMIRLDSQGAEVLTGIAPDSRDRARRAARQLLGRGVHTVVLDAGIDGNLVLSSHTEQWLPRVPVDTVDVTGAGDAFVGTLANLETKTETWWSPGPIGPA